MAVAVMNRAPVGQPTYAGQAYAYINISDIHLVDTEHPDGKDYPLRSSESGLMYTVMFSGNDDPFSFSGNTLPKYCFDNNIELIKAGYCYRGNLIVYGRKGFVGFEKQLDRTEDMLMKTFEAASAEPAKIEVSVPTVDWRFTCRVIIWTALLVYLLAMISLMIVR